MSFQPTYDGKVPRHPDAVIELFRAKGWWGEDSIDDRLAVQVEKNRDSVAVVDSDVRITYAELNELVTRAAGGLRSLGVGVGDFVTLALPNWWEQVIVTFGAVRLGAIVAPVSVRLRGELEFILEYTDSKVVVVPEEFHGFGHRDLIEEMSERLPNLAATVVVRSTGPQSGQAMSFEQLLEAGQGAKDFPKLDSDDPWQVIFTSGTTGAPKGVVRTHNITVHTIDNLINHYRYFDGDGSAVALAVLPISFVFAQYLCELGALLTGGRLVLLEDFTPAEMFELINREGVTYTGIVPSMVSRLLEEPNKPDEFPTLQCVSPAGEAVTPERKEQMADIFSCAIRESYGLAECTWPLGQLPEAPTDKLLGRTGTQSPTVSIQVVDDGAALGPDEIGELLLGGPTLFPGYLGNPDVTASVIADDGWFQTGDLAYFDDDGYYAICGRKKDVIKRSGAQVIPQEIEDALSAHPSVKEVAVVGLPDDRRGEIACACVVPEPNTTVTASELLEFLDGKLATYKLPERIELFQHLPISNNGKILKNELRDKLVAT